MRTCRPLTWNFWSWRVIKACHKGTTLWSGLSWEIWHTWLEQDFNPDSVLQNNRTRCPLVGITCTESFKKCVTSRTYFFYFNKKLHPVEKIVSMLLFWPHHSDVTADIFCWFAVFWLTDDGLHILWRCWLAACFRVLAFGEQCSSSILLMKQFIRTQS